MKRYLVMVPQLIVGGERPFYFDLLQMAQLFAEETGGTLYESTAK
jgi:hypothetical protein